MYVALRDNFLEMIDDLGHKQAFIVLRELGLSAVEVEVDRNLAMPSIRFLSSLQDEAALSQLKVQLQAQDCQIAALLMHNDFSGDIDAEVDWVVKTAELAAKLEVGAIRIDLVPHRPVSEDVFLTLAIDAMRRAISKAPNGVKFAVENHGSITNNRRVIETLLDALDERHFGMAMDTGNFYWYGLPLDEVYDLLSFIAPRTCHTHLKNIKYPENERNSRRPIGWEYEKYVTSLPEGDIDHAKVATCLWNAGYRGALTIEDESLGSMTMEARKATLLRDIEHIKTIVDHL